MGMTKFFLATSLVSILACGTASADMGNPLSGLNELTPPSPKQIQIPKAANLLDPTAKPVLSVNPRDLKKSHTAATPHAAQPNSVPASAGAGHH